VAAQGRVLQVQGQARSRPRLVGQHRLGGPQPDRLLCKQLCQDQFFLLTIANPIKLFFFFFPIFAVYVSCLLHLEKIIDKVIT